MRGSVCRAPATEPLDEQDDARDGDDGRQRLDRKRPTVVAVPVRLAGSRLRGRWFPHLFFEQSLPDGLLDGLPDEHADDASTDRRRSLESLR